MDSLISQIQDLASTADYNARSRICSKLRELAASIETPREMTIRYTFMYTQHAIAQMASDLRIFEFIDESSEPLTAEDISSETGGDPALICRILRYLASQHMIIETGENIFAANHTTHNLSLTPGKAAIAHGFKYLNKAIQELPTFLKAKGYRDFENNLDTASQVAFNTDQPAFVWMQQQPEVLHNCQTSLLTLQSPISWTSVVPIDQKLSSIDDGAAPVFVDIGGGHGFQCDAFNCATSGQFSGRIIHQDLAGTLAAAPSYHGVRKMEQDFFEEQQVKNAAIYYMKNIIHDHPDTKALEILQRVKEAMGPQSVLFIDEVVMPNTGASVMATQLDITMLAIFGALERTESDWYKLLGRAGFEVREIHAYDPEVGYSILEAVPTEAPLEN